VTPRLSRGAAAVLVAVLGLLVSLAVPGVAEGQPVAAEQGRQPPPHPPAPLARLELSDLSPRMVTVSSAPALRVTGRVVNAGDHALSQLGIRLQRGDAVDSDAAVTGALRGDAETPLVTRIQPVPGDLPPGHSSPFQFDVPLRDAPDSLQITQPGVYPLVVNLNGKPDVGGPTRLASVRLLLPVLGLPPATPGAPPGPLRPPPPQPAPLTVMWPLTAAPQRLPTAPGEPILIRSDRAGADPVAAEIAPGGRLDGLLGALEQAVPPGSPLAAAVCVAVDPQLLETLDGMSHGYRVSEPRGITDGTGAQDARSWLDRLRAAVQGRCVLPLPYADADLVALSRAGLTDLEAQAISSGARLVSDLLGVQPLTGVIWPAGEVIDERTLTDLTALQARAVLVDPRNLAPPPAAQADLVGLVGGSSSTPNPGTVISGNRDSAIGLLLDPLLTGALAGTTSPAASPAAATMPAQDGIGALVYRAASGRGIVLVPPRRWQVRGTDATALLNTARELLDAGFVTPRELPALAAARAATGTAAAWLAYPPQASAEEIPSLVTAEIQRDRDVLRDLQGATVLDPAANLRPASLLDPLRLGLLRAVSTAWREAPTRAVQLAVEQSSQLDELRRSVRIVQPPGPYSLAASDSPLLITVSNELPVGVQVALNLSETAGLRAGAVGLQLVPAHSTRQLVIPAKVTRAGQFSIDARLSTPGGTPLGEPSTLQLRSTAFGRVTVALTAGAGALLVLLVARRIVPKVRPLVRRGLRRRRRRTREAG
jgi:Family of unknown function (DUF6049)